MNDYPAHWEIADLNDNELSLWETLRPWLAGKEENITCFAGQGNHNSLSCPQCQESFQFGDIRIETANRTIVIEIEDSDAGLINMLKYFYAFSCTKPAKPLVLFHLWGGSYPTQKALYKWLRETYFQDNDYLQVRVIEDGTLTEGLCEEIVQLLE